VGASHKINIATVQLCRLTVGVFFRIYCYFFFCCERTIIFCGCLINQAISCSTWRWFFTFLGSLLLNAWLLRSSRFSKYTRSILRSWTWPTSCALRSHLFFVFVIVFIFRQRFEFSPFYFLLFTFAEGLIWGGVSSIREFIAVCIFFFAVFLQFVVSDVIVFVRVIVWMPNFIIKFFWLCTSCFAIIIYTKYIELGVRWVFLYLTTIIKYVHWGRRSSILSVLVRHLPRETATGTPF